MAANEIYDVIIVGGGPGGLTAGIYAKRAALKTVLIEKGVPGGQIAMTESVENYPGFEVISGFDLSTRFLKHAQAYDLGVLREEVVAVEPGLAYHTVRLSNGTELDAHAVILAVGGQPRKLGIPGEDTYYGRGVSYCGTCDGFFFRGKDVLVVGGGDTAVEEALYLAKLARRVTLVHRRDALRASRILQQRIMAECGVEIQWNTVPVGIVADEQGVCGAELEDTVTKARRQMTVDGVFIFVGFLPDNALVPAGVRMNADGYVMTDEKCETNIPGLFVVGDLRFKYARQIVIAAADGCTAAMAAAHYVEMRKGVTEVCVLPQE